MASISVTRVAIYGRVSTNNHGQDVTVQTRELEQFAQARGWRLVDSYLDIGISGAKDKRPELDRLMTDAHRRKFDVVIVWKFDRFARSVSHLLRALETFSALGIGFVSLSESLDTSTPAGKMVFTVLGAVAELGSPTKSAPIFSWNFSPVGSRYAGRVVALHFETRESGWLMDDQLLVMKNAHVNPPPPVAFTGAFCFAALLHSTTPP